MSKFTPGEWMRDGRTIYALDETGTANRFHASIQGGYTYCSRSGRDKTSHEELEATAILMWASPDLFEALLNLVEAVEGYAPEKFCNTFVMETDAARAALKKAGATP